MLEDTKEYISYAPKNEIKAQDRRPFDLLVRVWFGLVWLDRINIYILIRLELFQMSVAGYYKSKATEEG